ncbi:hypothetical protein YC2023_075045 [Brassica napus]
MGRCIFGRSLYCKEPPVNRTFMIFSQAIIESCHNLPLEFVIESETGADLDLTRTLHHKKDDRKHEVQHLIVQQPSDSTIEESVSSTTRNRVQHEDFSGGVAGWEAGSMRWMDDGSILSVRMRPDGKMVKMADLLALSIQTNL